MSSFALYYLWKYIVRVPIHRLRQIFDDNVNKQNLMIIIACVFTPSCYDILDFWWGLSVRLLDSNIEQIQPEVKTRTDEFDP